MSTPQSIKSQSLHGAAQATAELREVRRQAEENFAGWQRARADYENLRKEIAQQLSTRLEEGKNVILEQLLPIVDYFEAAMRHVPENIAADAWVEGVGKIYQAFEAFLRENGVERIATKGQSFDPSQHDAVAEEVTFDMPAGSITEVVAAGYVKNGRVLRPAKVRVAKPPTNN